jgi:hypothetical protein
MTDAKTTIILNSRLALHRRQDTPLGRHLERLVDRLQQEGVEVPDGELRVRQHLHALGMGPRQGLLPGAAGLAAPGDCVIVSDEDSERRAALAAGMRVCPNLALARAAARRIEYYYAKIEATLLPSGEKVLPDAACLEPLDLAVIYPHDDVLYAIATDVALEVLQLAGFTAGRLEGLLPPGVRTTSLRPNVTRLYLLHTDPAPYLVSPFVEHVLDHGEDEVFLAVPLGKSIEDYPHPTGGHGHTQRISTGRFDAPAQIPMLSMETSTAELSSSELAALATIDAGAIAASVALYCGATELLAGVRIRSRCVKHRDNSVAVYRICEDLQRAGLAPTRHAFEDDNGDWHENVIADLPGADPREVVIIGAHLDSTAGFDEAHVATRDPAPGANDDASGLAGVLAIAAALAALRPELRRTLRFALFNAEETGRAGSQRYAEELVASGVRVVAMFQLDMIGRHDERRVWEIHAGEPLRGNAGLADRLAAVTPQVAEELEAPRIFLESSKVGHVYSRSDHFSFAALGCHAVLVCERDVPRSAGDPKADANYHTSRDTRVNPQLAADIARVVAAAALTFARG